MNITFNNARRKAVFADWPLAGNKRGQCVFEVHTDPNKGERISRTTTGKPKFSTYCTKAAIVDGSNGKTYLLQYSTTYGHSVHISASDFMDARESDLGYRPYVTANSQNEEEERKLFAALHTMIINAQS